MHHYQQCSGHQMELPTVFCKATRKLFIVPSADIQRPVNIVQTHVLFLRWPQR